MTPAADIPFNRAASVGTEARNVEAAISAGHLAADGAFTARCREWLEEAIGCEAALLVHSCTAALEISAMLAEIGPGDEVLMPSYTFVSTANAFAIRGAVPVFVDIRQDTLNLDESRLEQAITSRTRAIVPVHYGGVSCEMDRICEIATAHGLTVIEDAAQGMMAGYRGRPLGGLGSMGALSFHETKNLTCGEGGALLLNSEDLLERAEILREKGTNRSRFLRGAVDKYTWVDIGSSYAMSDLNASFLWAQIERAQELTDRRMEVWNRYHSAFEPQEAAGAVRRPIVPEHCRHNAHMYYLLLRDQGARDGLIEHLRGLGIGAVFHYVPLHSAPAGRRYGRVADELPVTEDLSYRLVRLPIWPDLDAEAQATVISSVQDFLAADPAVAASSDLRSG